MWASFGMSTQLRTYRKYNRTQEINNMNYEYHEEKIPYLGSTLTVNIRQWRKDPVDYQINFYLPDNEFCTHGAINFWIRHAYTQGDKLRLDLVGAKVQGVIEREYTIPRSSKLWQQVYNDLITIAQRLTDPDGPAIKKLSFAAELKKRRYRVQWARERITRIETEMAALPSYRDDLATYTAELADFEQAHNLTPEEQDGNSQVPDQS